MTVRGKLLGGFGAVVVLLVVAVVPGVNAMGSINGKTNTIGHTDTPAVQEIGKINLAKADYRAGIFKLILTTNAAEIQYHEAVQPAIKLAAANRNTEAFQKVSEQQPLREKLDATLATWADYNQKLADKDVAGAASAYSSSRTLLLVLGLLAVLAAAAIALVLARSIVSRVGKMLTAAEGIAQGYVEQDVAVAGTDELAQTGAAFERMVAYLKELADIMRNVAAGDLTVTVTPRSERDLLGTSLQAMGSDLRTVVSDVSSGAGTISAASQQMASTSDEAGKAVGEIAAAVGDVAQGAERQVRMVESTRTAVQEAARAAGASAAGAQDTATAAGVAREGIAAAGEATSAIESLAESAGTVQQGIHALSEKSERIGGIVDTITGLAEQTNLLALNAAIEAARAGNRHLPRPPRASPSWRRRSASWPRSRRRRPGRSRG